jgi:hypothetical protein
LVLFALITPCGVVLQESTNCLSHQQLTADDIPVVVDKLIDFISEHGTRYCIDFYILNILNVDRGALSVALSCDIELAYMPTNLYGLKNSKYTLKLFMLLDIPVTAIK